MVVGLVVLSVLAVGVYLVRPFDGVRCDPGRECIPAAGVSLIIPPGWHRQPVDDPDTLFAAAPAQDSPVGLLIADGSTSLEQPAPTDLPHADEAVQVALDPTIKGFVSVGESEIDEVTLPIGRAVRARWTQTTAFIMTDDSSNVAYWCFVGGKLIEIEYVDDLGETGGPPLPSDVPPEVAATIASLRLLGPSSPTPAGP